VVSSRGGREEFEEAAWLEEELQWWESSNIYPVAGSRSHSCSHIRVCFPSSQAQNGMMLVVADAA
jgi:hypothetical protein